MRRRSQFRARRASFTALAECSPLQTMRGEQMEPEIIQLNIQRVGMVKVSLRAELIDLSDTCRLVIAWPVGSQERHYDAPDFYECLRAFRRVIEPDGFRVLCQGSPSKCFPLWDCTSWWCLEELYAHARSASFDRGSRRNI